MNKKIKKRDNKMNEVFENDEILEAIDKVTNDMKLERTDEFNDKLISVDVEDLIDFKPDFFNK